MQKSCEDCTDKLRPRRSHDLRKKTVSTIREQRRSLLRTTEKFHFSVEFFYEACGAESGDGFALILNAPGQSVKFHPPILSDGVGQIRSQRKLNFSDVNAADGVAVVMRRGQHF